MNKLNDIFPLAKNEQESGSGRYLYRLNGALTNIVEPWLQHRQPDGSVITRSSRSDGESFVLAVKAGQKGDSRFATFYWENAAGSREAHYLLRGDEFRWSVDGEQPTRLLLDSPVCFFPLMRILSGETLLTIDSKGGTARVLVPSIKTPEHRDSLFMPLFSERSVEALGSNIYHYRGGEYDDAARYEMNERGLLQRYSWQQSENQFWEVELA